MSAIVLSGRPARRSVSLLEGLRQFRSAEPRLFDLGMLLLLAMLPTGFAAVVDPRTMNGVDIWEKPLKFEFALAVYLLTLVLFAPLLPSGTTVKRWYRLFVTAVIVAVVAEMVWIGGASALGAASHFNTGRVGGIVYPLMGAIATLLTSLTAVYAWQIARNPATGLSPVVKEGVVLGLALVLPLTLVTAGTLASGTGHWVGGTASDANGLALMGWSRDGGDLRVAHFFASHAMHFFPAFALVWSWILGGANRAPVRLFALLFCAFVAFTLGQALMGQPFLAFLG